MVILKKKCLFIFYAALFLNLSNCVQPVTTDSALAIDPLDFTVSSTTSQKTIEIGIDLNKVEATSIILSAHSFCLGEKEQVSATMNFSIPEEVYNKTFSLYAQLQKNGAVSDCVKIKEITHDNIAPQSPSLKINAGALATSAAEVTLTLSAKEASHMYITSQETCAELGEWEVYKESKTWTLNQTNAAVKVYAKFKDEVGNETACIEASITHDGVAPANPSIVINNGDASTSSTSVTLTLTEDDSSEVYVTNTPGCSADGSWAAFTTPATKNWVLGQTNTTATVYAKFRDSALNESSCTSASILHDSEGPTIVSLSINDNANSTNSSSVALTLNATDASQMYITNTPNCESGGTWADFSTPVTQSWVLEQTNTTATVYAKVRDSALNESSCTSASILHDAIGPTDISFSINNDASTTHLSSVSLTLDATDASQMYITNTPGCQTGGTLEDYATSKTWVIPTTVESHSVYVKFLDTLGNSSDCISNAIQYFPWEVEAYIKASNTEAGDRFGYSATLSSDGLTLAVGAIYEDSNATGVNGNQSNNSTASAGAVYIFTRSSLSEPWSQQTYLKASTPVAADSFGYFISFSGDGSTLAVGAPWQSGGYVSIFVRNGTSWSEQTIVRASNVGSGDGFGLSLALSFDGSTLAVGAFAEDSSATGINGTDDNSATDSGSVYIYTRSGTTWSQQTYIKASNTGAGDWFGYYLALSADASTLAVGATKEDSNATGINGNQSDNSASSSGALYVFTSNGGTWSQQAYIKGANTGAGDGFGASVSLSSDGSTLATGASGEDSNATGINGDQSNNSVSDSGAAYIFTRSGTTWSQQAFIKSSNAETNDWFGATVTLSADGSTLAVGATGEDSNATGVGGDQTNNSVADSGAVYAFTRSGNTWSQKSYIKATNTRTGNYFAESTLCLSGDGSTLVVGSSLDDSNATGVGGDQTNTSASSAGAVYLY